MKLFISEAGSLLSWIRKNFRIYRFKHSPHPRSLRLNELDVAGKLADLELFKRHVRWMRDYVSRSFSPNAIFRALYLRIEEGRRRGQGGGGGGRHRATDCRDCDTTSELSKDRNYRGYPSTVSKFQSNGFSLFARFDGCFPRVKSLAYCQLLSTLLARDQSEIILAPWHEKPVGIKSHLRVFMHSNRTRLRIEPIPQAFKVY